MAHGAAVVRLAPLLLVLFAGCAAPDWCLLPVEWDDRDAVQIAGRLFDDGNSDYLEESATPAPASAPVTMYAQCSRDSVSAAATIFGYFAAGVSQQRARVFFVAGDEPSFQIGSHADGGHVSHSGTLAVNTWGVVSGSGTSSPALKVAYDGSYQTSGADAWGSYVGADTIDIGVMEWAGDYIQHFSGTIGPCAAWAADQGQGSHESLGIGRWPAYAANSDDLSFFTLMTGGAAYEVDVVGGLILADQNGSTKAGHKPLCPWPTGAGQ